MCDHGQLVAAYRRDPEGTTGNAARMLRETLCVMRANRPSGDRGLLDAWREGYRSWQDVYGTQLAEEIRRDLREGGVWRVARKAATLLHLAPSVFRRELMRKPSARKTLAGVSP